VVKIFKCVEESQSWVIGSNGAGNSLKSSTLAASA
jgi:hypothetical protein